MSFDGSQGSDIVKCSVGNIVRGQKLIKSTPLFSFSCQSASDLYLGLYLAPSRLNSCVTERSSSGNWTWWIKSIPGMLPFEWMYGACVQHASHLRKTVTAFAVNLAFCFSRHLNDSITTRKVRGSAISCSLRVWEPIFRGFLWGWWIRLANQRLRVQPHSNHFPRACGINTSALVALVVQACGRPWKQMRSRANNRSFGTGKFGPKMCI